MDVQVQRFDDLNDRGQELSQLINSDAAAVERINSQLLEFQERWDNLVQQMEFQSKEVIYTTKMVEFVCPPNSSETVAVKIMKLSYNRSGEFQSNDVRIFSSAYPFPDFAALTYLPYISRSSAVRPTLQTLAPIQSSISFSQGLFGLRLFRCACFEMI